jgi:hypothetical protein
MGTRKGGMRVCMVEVKYAIASTYVNITTYPPEQLLYVNKIIKYKALFSIFKYQHHIKKAKKEKILLNTLTCLIQSEIKRPKQIFSVPC